MIRCVYDISPFQKKEINAPARAVETLDEENSNDEKCFMEQSKPATNHPYCQASHIYDLMNVFVSDPKRRDSLL